MSTILPYVFIPGDNWQDIAISAGVTQKESQRVVAAMRFFANHPDYERWLLRGGVGWMDLPCDGMGKRLHYRTLVRAGARPQIYGLGFFHTAEERGQAGGLIALAEALDKKLTPINPLLTFSTGESFSIASAPAHSFDLPPLPWADMSGRTFMESDLATVYRHIRECCSEEGGWPTQLRILVNMPKIKDADTAVFITSDCPCKSIVRPTVSPESPDAAPERNSDSHMQSGNKTRSFHFPWLIALACIVAGVGMLYHVYFLEQEIKQLKNDIVILEAENKRLKERSEGIMYD